MVKITFVAPNTNMVLVEPAVMKYSALKYYPEHLKV
jgi:hypothetical protein